MKPLHKCLVVALAAVVAFAVLLHAEGSSSTSIKVKAVWIYPFENGQSGSFQGVTILEKTPNGIRFRSGEQVFEHCGHYTIEN